jgi:DNA-binding SARP family transcriptional activator
MNGLSIRLLGSPHVELGGRPAALETRKATALLAYLAVRREPVSRDHLAALFWPDYEPSRAFANLRRTLWSLHRDLGERWIDAGQTTVSLAPQEGLWIDVEHFQALLERGKSHGHGADDVCLHCRPLLEEAVELARGEFLEGFSLPDAVDFDDWQTLHAARQHAQTAGALKRLVSLLILAGDLAEALGYAQRLAELDPLDQPAQRLLILLLAWTEQSAAALRQYRTVERLLAGELNMPPEAETQRLFDAIKAGRTPPPPPARLAAASPAAERQPLPTATTAPAEPDFLRFAQALRPEPTLFVARQREQERLDQALHAAAAGQLEIAFVLGDAGQGKSALLHAFAQRAMDQRPDLVVAAAACNAYTGAGDPFSPWRQLLGALTGDVEAQVLAGDLAQAHARRLWQAMPAAAEAIAAASSDLLGAFVAGRSLLARVEMAVAPATPWLAELRRQVAARAPRPTDPTLAQSDLFEQYVGVLRAVARRGPLLLLLDDLHWADQGSINLLFHLSRRLAGAPVMILGAYRPTELAAGRGGERHPLEPIVHELQRQRGEILLNLGGEGRSFVDVLVDAFPNRVDEAFRAMLFRLTDGHPLFTVELLRGMQARGDMLRDDEGYWVARPGLDWSQLPARVEAVIAERIDRLPAGLQELLRVASVEGEEFTAEAAAAVLGQEAADVVRRLSRQLDREQRLVRAVGIRHDGDRRLSRYRFRHYLIQRYLYQSLDPVECAYLNDSVGRALEQVHAGRTEEIAVALTRHFEEAGNVAQAARYLLQAGQRAALLTDNAQAIRHLRRGLALLADLPQSVETQRLEMALLGALGAALIATLGWGVDEVDAIFSRARALAEALECRAELFALLGITAHYYMYRGQGRAALAIAEDLVRLAEGTPQPDSAALLEAYTMRGACHYWLGNLPDARENLARGLSYYDVGRHHPLTYVYGQDPGCHAMLYLMHCLLFLGYPDQALAMGERLTDLAEELAHPFTLAFALSWKTLMLAECGAWERVAQCAETVEAICTRHGFPTWLSNARAWQGHLAYRAGDRAGGLDRTGAAFGAALDTGAQATMPYYIRMLGEMSAGAGRLAAGLELTRHALEMAVNHEEGWCETAVRLTLADLLWQDGDPAAAEAQIRLGLAKARGQQARYFELRAALHLHRLGAATGSASLQAEAREAVATVYTWFSEGFDLPLLAETRRLLEAGRP